MNNKDINIERIKELCKNKNMRWTNHILVRMLKRNISIEDVRHAIASGEVIEQYPNDYPHPSCLVSGASVNNNYIHVVCGISGTELHLVTAYYPNSDEWSEDFKFRKEISQ